MISKEQKAQIVAKYGANKKDTGNIFGFYYVFI